MKLCLYCKSEHPEGLCPLLKNKVVMKASNFKEEFEGSTPNIFVGEYGYPKVNVGFLSPQVIDESAWMLDAPHFWNKNKYKIPDVVNIRSSLVNARFQTRIKDDSKQLEIARETAMTTTSADIDFHLGSKPKGNLTLSEDTKPHGPAANLSNAKIVGNTKIHTKVDKVVDDTDLLASDALTYLNKNNFNENFLTKLFSVGNLGEKKRRKLVPTKWSITAVDDILGKSMIKSIREYSFADPAVFFGGHLGNYLVILCFPEEWGYELFEMYQDNILEGKLQYTTNAEEVMGRKTYAEETAGGYYAARLPILTHLKNHKKQGSFLAIRIITKEYTTPLGVWVLREAVKNAMERRTEIASREQLIPHASAIIQKYFNFDPSFIFKASLLLKARQQTLMRYAS